MTTIEIQGNGTNGVDSDGVPNAERIDSSGSWFGNNPRADGYEPMDMTNIADHPLLKSMSAMMDEHLMPPQNTFLQKYYKKFTVTTTINFVWQSSRGILCVFIPWIIFIGVMDYSDDALAEKLQAHFLLKILTFLVGILISLNLKQAVDHYRTCLGNIIDFRAEFKAFWYAIQTQTVDQRAARFVFDIHMVAFCTSVIRFMNRKCGLEEDHAFDLVQDELSGCILLQREGPYAQLFANPTHAEFLLVSWLRVLGVMDRDTRLRWERVRRKLHQLTVRVQSPDTPKHLLRVVLIIFLFMVPICVEALATKLAMPLICMVLSALLQLSEELQDPFGDDRHDLPLYDILSVVCRIHVEDYMKKFLQETLEVFNEACRTGIWEKEKARKIFGEDCKFEPKDPKIAYDTGIMYLSFYTTLQDLLRLDVVGYISTGDPDVLFSNPDEMFQYLADLPQSSLPDKS